jgi:hypothetical protein
MWTPEPGWFEPTAAPRTSAKTARDCLKPIVFVFATLSPTTPSAPLSAESPETPSYMALRMLIFVFPYFVAGGSWTATRSEIGAVAPLSSVSSA